MIQKLEQSVIGTNYGHGGASFSEVIDKVNEVIDYINSWPEEIPPCLTGFKGHTDPVGRRGRQGMVPRWISEKAEEYQRQMEPPYDSDDIISAYESGAMWNDKKFVYGPKGHPDPPGVSDLEGAAEEYASKTLCDPDDGPSVGLVKESFIAGANYQRLKRLVVEGVKSSSHLDAYIEGVRRSIEKQIGQLPPPPPGYYYTWELDTIRKEGQSFTAISRPVLKQINPEHNEQLKAKH